MFRLSIVLFVGSCMILSSDTADAGRRRRCRRCVPCQSACSGPIVIYSDNCDEKKSEQQARFNHVVFSDCNFPDPESAEAAAATLYAQYVITNPKCTRNVTKGHSTVAHKGGIPYNTFLGWVGCDDL